MLVLEMGAATAQNGNWDGTRGGATNRRKEKTFSKNLYAVVGVWEMDASRWDEQRRSLHEQIVPMVSQTPGFVGGYWMGDQTASKTYSTIILEDEEAAQRFKAFVEGDSARENQERFGVRNASLTVVEVFAEAHR